MDSSGYTSILSSGNYCYTCNCSHFILDSKFDEDDYEYDYIRSNDFLKQQKGKPYRSVSDSKIDATYVNVTSTKDDYDYEDIVSFRQIQLSKKDPEDTDHGYVNHQRASSFDVIRPSINESDDIYATIQDY